MQHLAAKCQAESFILSCSLPELTVLANGNFLTVDTLPNVLQVSVWYDSIFSVVFPQFLREVLKVARFCVVCCCPGAQWSDSQLIR